jgi:hypothetical protein
MKDYLKDFSAPVFNVVFLSPNFPYVDAFLTTDTEQKDTERGTTERANHRKDRIGGTLHEP